MKQLISIMLLLAVMQTGRAQVAGTPYIGYTPSSAASTAGKDFWLTFTSNYNYTPDVNFGPPGSNANVSFELMIATNLQNTVTISFTADSVNGAPRSFTYNLAAGESRRIVLYAMSSDGSTDAPIDERAAAYGFNGDASFSGVLNNTIHIISAQPIVVYAFNVMNETTDGTCVYSVPTWGTEYRPIAYSGIFQPGEVVVANQDGTNVFINGSATPAATLKAGQLYIVQGTPGDDFTGRLFTSSKPVAYFASVPGLNIVGSFADMFQEQMVSVDKWDTKYFVPNVPQFSANTTPDASGTALTTNNHIRIVASKDNTQVNYKGAFPDVSNGFPNENQIASGGTLNAGQYVELVINDRDSGAYITANNPIGVADYLVGGNTNVADIYGYTITDAFKISGDPDNAVIPGLSQMIQNVTMSPFMFPIKPGALNYTAFGNTSAVQHGAVIVTPTANKGNVVMTKGSDPTNLLLTDPNGGTWIDDANGSGMSVYRYIFDDFNDIGSSFTIKSLAAGSGIMVLGYGLANFESYYYDAGSGLKAL